MQIVNLIKSITINDVVFFITWVFFGAGGAAWYHGHTTNQIILFSGWAVGMLYCIFKSYKKE